MDVSAATAFFLGLAVVTFVLMWIVQLLFPVERYEQVKEMRDVGVVTKGRFAYLVESIYQIKTKGLKAEGKYWWHLIWFNSATSLMTSVVVVLLAAATAVVAIGAAIMLGMLILGAIASLFE